MKTSTISAFLSLVFFLFCSISFTTLTAQTESGVDDDDVLLYWFEEEADTETKAGVPDHISIKAFPNPSTGDELNIAFINLTEESFVEVYNENGQSMYKGRLGDEKENVGLHTLDISQFATGMYFVRLVASNYQIMKKVIVQN